MFSIFFEKLSLLFNEQNGYKHVEEIYNNDRKNCFSGYKKTAAFCVEQMRKTGLEEVEMLPLNADGRSAYLDWVIPKAWDAVKGRLTLIDCEGKEIVLADYCTVPCSLMMYSAATPQGGVDAELIEYNPGCGSPGQCLKVKLLLTGSVPAAITDIAVENDATGIISDFIPLYQGIRENKDIMIDACRWENAFMCPENSSGIFGFSISPRTGIFLRDLLKKEAMNGRKVILHAEVETMFSQDTVYTVSGVIRGTNPDMGELMVLSHLYETGANDNATGCGAALELAAAISEGIRKGIIDQPKCNIRLAMGFESAGPAGYFASYPERMEKTAAAINLDMVGSIEEENAILSIWHNPLSNWSYTDTLIVEIISEYGKYIGTEIPFRSTGYSIGDNLIADPMIGIPTVSMLMYPSLSYHSSMDDMSRVSTAVLKQIAVIAGTLLIFLSSPDIERVHWLLDRIRLHAEVTICRETTRGEEYCLMLAEAFHHGCIRLLRFSELPGNESINAIKAMAEGIRRRLRTVSHEFGYSGQEAGAEAAGAEAAGAVGASGTAGQYCIPVRKVKGPVTFHTLPYELRKTLKWDPFYNYELNCPLYWMDGRRNTEEIARLAAIELGKDFTPKYLKEIIEFFQFLNENGYIDLEL
ncbi:MAG: M28 family peptidase [Clostridiaceae bacterium]|nr:M28 family peptidase [Clostridiaceae bacterium]